MDERESRRRWGGVGRQRKGLGKEKNRREQTFRSEGWRKTMRKGSQKEKERGENKMGRERREIRNEGGENG